MALKQTCNMVAIINGHFFCFTFCDNSAKHLLLLNWLCWGNWQILPSFCFKCIHIAGHKRAGSVILDSQMLLFSKNFFADSCFEAQRRKNKENPHIRVPKQIQETERENLTKLNLSFDIKNESLVISQSHELPDLWHHVTSF